MPRQLVDFEIDELPVLLETEKAVMVKNIKEEEVWLPKSQVEIVNNHVVIVPQWLAEDKELV
jgi:hypothetical protein